MTAPPPRQESTVIPEDPALGRPDVIEDDVMYDPRAHLQPSAFAMSTHIELDVSYHGHEVQHHDDPQWDGQVHAIDDDNLNPFDIDDLLNNELFEQCEECMEQLLNNE